MSLVYYQPIGPAALIGLAAAVAVYGYLIISQDEETAIMLLAGGIIFLVMQAIFIYVLG